MYEVLPADVLTEISFAQRTARLFSSRSLPRFVMPTVHLLASLHVSSMTLDEREAMIPANTAAVSRSRARHKTKKTIDLPFLARSAE